LNESLEFSLDCQTTLFATTEASMLSVTAASSNGVSLSLAAEFSIIGIMGGLVVHSSAGM
jgi:hypothetical protein